MQKMTADNAEQTAEHEQEASQQNNRSDTGQSCEEKSILIVFATRYGHSAKIVQQLVNAVNLLGHRTVVIRADRESPPEADTFARDISCVIVGGPLYMGRFPRVLSKFINQYRNVLKLTPSAFFSVSLATAGDDNKEKGGVHNIMERFFDKSRWHPCHKASFAGALLYTRYGPLIRYFMRRMTRTAGGDTDTHRDYVYTDWNDILVFAQQIDSMIKLGAQESHISTE